MAESGIQEISKIEESEVEKEKEVIEEVLIVEKTEIENEKDFDWF